MSERMRFIVAVDEGEVTMAAACRQFGISRKTGYKWLARYRQEGIAGLADRSRAPQHCPHAVTPEVREAVLALRGQYPTWGPKKVAAKLEQVYPNLVVPAPSTIGDLLAAAGLVVPRRRRRHVPPRTQPLAHATRPNVVWCADFKGDFVLGDGTRCYPLTISDADSRFLLRCQAVPTTATERVPPLFEATFREFGLPDRLRTDNGSPFASVALGGRTALSVWWVKLGITPERIDAGKPSQNGRHERMHLTLKLEACQDPGHSLRGQQHGFDQFRQIYTEERPHEAFGQRTPASIYQPSLRPFPDRLPELTDPTADGVRRVRPSGCIRWQGREIYVSKVLIGEPVGLTQIDEGRWQVTFGPLELGNWTTGHRLLIPVPRSRRPHNTTTTNSTCYCVTHVPGLTCYLCRRSHTRRSPPFRQPRSPRSLATAVHPKATQR
jgi:transposase InsO family protein